jgi:hypothetical protein
MCAGQEEYNSGDARCERQERGYQSFQLARANNWAHLREGVKGDSLICAIFLHL